jgi:hypothetical protein
VCVVSRAFVCSCGLFLLLEVTSDMSGASTCVELSSEKLIMKTLELYFNHAFANVTKDMSSVTHVTEYNAPAMKKKAWQVWPAISMFLFCCD